MPSVSAAENADEEIQRLRTYGTEELSTLFDNFTPQLNKLIRNRLNPTIRSRVDESDILQETFLEAVRRMPSYLSSPTISPYVWLRQVTKHVLFQHYRFHVETAKRSVNAEHQDQVIMGTPSEIVAPELAGSITSPSSQFAKAELRDAIADCLSTMSELEREVICLKQLEKLSFAQIAEELNIPVSCAKKTFQAAAIVLAKAVNSFGSNVR